MTTSVRSQRFAKEQETRENWSSPTISTSFPIQPETSGHNDDGLTHPPRELTDLKSGWYGFCFTTGPSCGCPAALAVENVTVKKRTMHSLPFKVEKPLISLDYGYLIYITPDCSIRVEVAPNCGKCHGTLQWRLVLKHASSVETMVGGELTDRSKCVVCWSCVRTFASVRAAQLHHEDCHRVRPPDSVWTMPLRVVYQDDDVVVVDKPQGISIHGGDLKTLQKSDLLLPLAGPRLPKPIIVHRLDAPTGGILVMAKTKDAERALKISFMEHRCTKIYRAVVFGRVVSDEGLICEPISGKKSQTRYKVVRRSRSADERADGWITTLDLYPITGRKHQIRRHLKYIGHPIWGDRRHGDYRGFKIQHDELLSEEDRVDQLHRSTVESDPHARLCLWATYIELPHPTTKVTMEAELGAEPTWISKLILHEESLYRRCQISEQFCDISEAS